jgi:hypothetical protein
MNQDQAPKSWKNHGLSWKGTGIFLGLWFILHWVFNDRFKVDGYYGPGPYSFFLSLASAVVITFVWKSIMSKRQ